MRSKDKLADQQDGENGQSVRLALPLFFSELFISHQTKHLQPTPESSNEIAEHNADQIITTESTNTTSNATEESGATYEYLGDQNEASEESSAAALPSSNESDPAATQGEVVDSGNSSNHGSSPTTTDNTATSSDSQTDATAENPSQENEDTNPSQDEPDTLPAQWENITASFAASEWSACVGSEIDFQPKMIVEKLSYHWNFGDRSSADLAQVSHLFESPGEFEVELSISNSTSGEIISTSTEKIIIYDTPEVEITSESREGQGIPTYTFSYESDEPYITKWFVDGRMYSDQPTFEHTFRTKGEHLVELRV